MGCCCYLQNVQNLLADGKSQNERRSGEFLKEPIVLIDAWVGYVPNSERQSENSSIWKESITRIFLGYALIAGRNLGGRYSDC